MYFGIFLLIKMSKLMIHAKTWVNLKCIMLSESSQTQKATYYIVVVNSVSHSVISASLQSLGL